ncbi:MAG: AraC family transcriptional regulator [Mangrovibacterium sp.]
MKIMHERLILQGKKPIKIKWDEFPHFTFPWHFHPEYELVYVIKSFGKRFVADHAEDFKEGDLVLLGPNLPHFWKNNELFYSGDPRYQVNAVVVHFPEDFLAHELESYSEFFRIGKLLKRAARGISFPSEVSAKIGPQLRKLLKKKGLEQLLGFIRILDKLAGTEGGRLLSSENYQPDFLEWPSERMERVMHLINTGYREPISQETIARRIGMNSSAFSRYFREKTGKSFTNFVSEMRIGYACKLLQEGKLSVSQIGFESGFNNLSNFNRSFRKINSCTPTQYRNQFLGANSAQDNKSPEPDNQ